MMKESEIINKTKEGYTQEFNTIPDNSSFLDQLKELNNKEKKPVFLFWLSKPIPAYSLALASLLFMVLFLIKTTKTNELIVYRDAETLIRYDTIVIRDTINISNEIYSSNNKTRKNLVKKESSRKKKNSSIPIQTVVNEGEFHFDKSQISNQQNLSGSSSADSELAQFLGVNI